MLANLGRYAPTILHVRRHRDNANHEAGMRPYYRLLHIQEGTFDLTLDDKQHLASDGDVVLIPAGLTLQCQSHERSRCQSISFTVMATALERAERQALRLRPRTAAQPQPEAIWDCSLATLLPRPLAESIRDVISFTVETCWQGALHRLAGNHRLAFILERIVQYHYRQTADARPINKAQNLLDQVHGIVHEHYHSLRTAGDIARRLGISISQMNHTYSNHSNETPLAYLRRYRLNQTARLLLDSDAKLEEIARTVGFRNAQSLQQAWRQEYDLPPRQWRLHQRQT